MKRPGSDFFYFYSIMKKKYKKKVCRIEKFTEPDRP